MTYDPEVYLRDDWRFTEGVTNAGVSYGPDTYTVGKATAPGGDVKVRRGNPTQNQIAVAASTVGYRTTDQVFTIWANTLREDPTDPGSERVFLVEGDLITHRGQTWIIQWIKETIYATQYVAYCRLSTTTPDRGT